MRAQPNGRGVHPKVLSSSFRFWTFDDAATSINELVTSNLTLNNFGIATNPSIVLAPVGGLARRYNDGVTTDISATGDASGDSSTMQGEWTCLTWLRVREIPGAGVQTVWAHGGTASDETQPHNLQGSLVLDSNGNFGVEWENGAGVDVQALFTSYAVPVDRWIHVGLRKESQGGGLYTVDLLINGEVIETTNNLANADGGSDSAVAWSFGARVNGTTAAAATSVDVSSFMSYDSLLPIDDVKTAFRRGRMLGFWTHVDTKVEVTDANGNRRDLTDLDGVDFVDNFSIADSVDNAVKTATLNLTREQRDLSVALLRTDSKLNLTDVDVVTSYDPLIDVVREIEFFAARVPLGVRANGLDWQSVLLGKIDNTNAGGEANKVTVRDRGADLVDTYIEEEVLNPAIITGAPPEKQPSYGLPAGEALESILQKVLNDNDNDAGNDSVAGLVPRLGSYDPYALAVPVSPTWLVVPYRQKRESVMTAVRNLAGMIGWECRFRYVENDNPDLSGWFVTLYDADRDRLDVDTILNGRELLNAQNVGLDVKQIRNVVRIIYPSSETTDPAPTNPDPTRFLQRYGWSGVDGEGNRVPAFYELESIDSRDRYGRRFMEIGEANSSQIDTVVEAQRFALGALSDLEEPNLEQSLTTEVLFELDLGDMIRVEPVKELYTAAQRSAVVGYTHNFGDKATSTLEMRGKPAISFGRWLELETRPGQGRPGVADPRLALTDSESGPLLRVIRQVIDRTSYFQGGKYLALQNPNFQSWSAGVENPPDGWEVAGGAVWGADIVEEASILASGGHAIRFTSVTGYLQSKLVPVDGLDESPYTIEVRYQQPTGAPDSSIAVRVRWFDENQTEIVLDTNGLSCHRAESPSAISSLQRTANVATVTTSAAHGYSTGDIVSVRPANVTANNQGFREERARIAVTSATTFTYPNTGGNIGPLTDTGPEGGSVNGTVVLRPRSYTCPVPSAVGEYVLCREVALEPPTGDARYARVEILRSGTSEVVVDKISVYRAARETRLTPRAQFATQLGAWRMCFFRGDNPRWSDGFDYGRNWISQSPTGSALPIGNTQYVAKEDQRVRVFAKASFSESGGTINDVRLRIVKNETYDTAGVPDAVGTVVVTGENAQPGGAGVAAGLAIASVSGEVFLSKGDTLCVEHYVDGSPTILYGVAVSESFFEVKQEDLD